MKGTFGRELVGYMEEEGGGRKTKECVKGDLSVLGFMGVFARRPVRFGRGSPPRQSAGSDFKAQGYLSRNKSLCCEKKVLMLTAV